MNIAEIIYVVLIVALYATCYFAPETVKTRFTTPLRRWTRPLVEKLFPSLRKDPWLFEPIAAQDLPLKQRHHFEAHSAAYVSHGFTLLGDFVIRRDAEPSCTRFFLSRDRTSIGELACYLGSQTVGCMTVLLDGFYIESANTELNQLPPAEHGLEFCLLKTDDAAEVIEHHAACVARTAAVRGTQPAPLTPSDLQAVVNHGRQLSLRSLHHQGVLAELPDFLKDKQP